MDCWHFDWRDPTARSLLAVPYGTRRKAARVLGVVERRRRLRREPVVEDLLSGDAARGWVNQLAAGAIKSNGDCGFFSPRFPHSYLHGQRQRCGNKPAQHVGAPYDTRGTSRL
jgi:hypothetical protein